MALEKGATRARIISARDIVIDKRVRLKCLAPRCENYGRHLMCPPSTIDVDEFSEMLAAFRYALILQVDADYDSADRKGFDLKARARQKPGRGREKRPELILHGIVNEIERRAFKEGYYLAAGLIASDCSLCEECVGVGSDQACRHPFEARPSMQSLGVDVLKTCERVGMPVRFSSREPVRWTGLVLLG